MFFINNVSICGKKWERDSIFDLSMHDTLIIRCTDLPENMNVRSTQKVEYECPLHWCARSQKSTWALH